MFRLFCEQSVQDPVPTSVCQGIAFRSCPYGCVMDRDHVARIAERGASARSEEQISLAEARQIKLLPRMSPTMADFTHANALIRGQICGIRRYKQFQDDRGLRAL